MFDELEKFLYKPKLFETGTDNFWNDEHISKKLLEAHLNPDIDAASRTANFIDRSVDWITKKMPATQYKKLLDLGCGPGLYTERFSHAGYTVTGIDFSRRSIEYAKNKAANSGSKIQYYNENYLTIDLKDEFDIVTLIYCDFGALSTQNRSILLKKIYNALAKNGKLILDVFTPAACRNKEGSRSWEYYEKGGFWSEKPYLCLNAVYHYEEGTTELRQSIVQTEDGMNAYHVWEHFFTKDALLTEMRQAGFDMFELYQDVAGKEYFDRAETICGIFTK